MRRDRASILEAAGPFDAVLGDERLIGDGKRFDARHVVGGIAVRPAFGGLLSGGDRSSYAQDDNAKGNEEGEPFHEPPRRIIMYYTRPNFPPHFSLFVNDFSPRWEREAAHERYHRTAMKQCPPPALQRSLFRPGMRIAVACSGGADSVALLRALLERRSELGLVLSVAHMNHGIRGADSDGDEAFVEELAGRFALPLHLRRADVPGASEANKEGLEEAARNLRYAWFRELLATQQADAVATAHTLDDQAETVLHRLIRGAWTEGLGGIFPVLEPAPRETGRILRPFLAATRREIEAWLGMIGQPWREDASNQDTAYTRNRIRIELLPALAEYNPGIKTQFAQLASLAREEEAYWQAELARLLPSILLPGKPVRGGGRATDTLVGSQSLSIEVERLRALHPAVRRRVARAAASALGCSLDFDETERLIALCGLGDGENAVRPGTKLQMGGGLRAERTPREIRLLRSTTDAAKPAKIEAAEYVLPIPGEVDAPAFGLRVRTSVGKPGENPPLDARLRPSRPGDRVTLRHSRSSLKIAEALRRSRLPADAAPPVLEWQGEIVWMPGVALESRAAQAVALTITADPLPDPLP